MWKCKYCNITFEYVRTTDKANHSRHCKLNPKSIEITQVLKDAQQKATINQYGELKKFTVQCFSCKSDMDVLEREKLYPSKDKYFCTKSCAKSMGGKAKAEKYISSYVAIAWKNHKKECVVCGESNIVAVHHVNGLHDDNAPRNLVPLCPTHHHYMHSRFRLLIQHKVDDYIKTKWG